MTFHESAPTNRPSRGLVEILCILHAIGTRGCPFGDVAGRLGLSETLSSVVAEGVRPLVLTGLLAVDEARFTVTDAGQEMLNPWLADLDLGQNALDFGGTQP
jgi:hypothetical protein